MVADWEQGSEEIIAFIGELVQQEQGRCQAAQSAAAAEGLVQANAEALLHRIVAHFQHLFAVDDLEGVLPAMNQVLILLLQLPPSIVNILVNICLELPGGPCLL